MEGVFMSQKTLILILRIYCLPECQPDCRREPCNPENGILVPFIERRRKASAFRGKRPAPDEVPEKLRKRKANLSHFPPTKEAELDKTVQRLYGPTSTRRSAKKLPTIEEKRWVH
jgi:hypothetical protein